MSISGQISSQPAGFSTFSVFTTGKNLADSDGIFLTELHFVFRMVLCIVSEFRRSLKYSFHLPRICTSLLRVNHYFGV